MDKLEVLVIAFIVLLFGLAVGNYFANISQSTVTNTRGNLKTVGVQVYSSMNKTILEHVDWGILTPGENKNVTAYIHNVGNTNATITVTTTNYQPTILANYSTFICPLNNTMLRPNQIAETTFTLFIHYDIYNVTDFTFDIMIIASA